MPNPMQIGSYVGLAASKPAKSDDDEDMKEPKGDDEDAETPDPKPKKSGKNAKSADCKAKRKKPADDGGDNDEENDDDAELKGKKDAARTEERARCAAILSHPEAKGRESYAFHLAFGTNLPKSQALSLLAASPSATASGLSGHMQNFSNVTASHDAPRQSNKQAIATSWGTAAKKAGIKTA